MGTITQLKLQRSCVALSACSAVASVSSCVSQYYFKRATMRTRNIADKHCQLQRTDCKNDSKPNRIAPTHCNHLGEARMPGQGIAMFRSSYRELSSISSATRCLPCWSFMSNSQTNNNCTTDENWSTPQPANVGTLQGLAKPVFILRVRFMIFRIWLRFKYIFCISDS